MAEYPLSNKGWSPDINSCGKKELPSDLLILVPLTVSIFPCIQNLAGETPSAPTPWAISHS